MNVTGKHCSRCRLVKSVDEFGRNARSKDGLQWWCIACKREHYRDNRESIAAKQSEYRTANRDKVLEGKRRSYHANAEASREDRRRYRRENAETLRERAAIRYGQGGRPVDMPWPEGPVSYSAAHSRVKATYGSAKNHACIGCGGQAYAWAYDHSDPNPLTHQGVGLWANKSPAQYSADPTRYDPMCRSCHVKRDSYGAL